MKRYSGILDKTGTEIKDGDTLEIDFDAAAKIIKEGFLVTKLTTLKPTADARLKVEFRQARFRLIWRTQNGGVDTGSDLADIDCITSCVEVAA